MKLALNIANAQGVELDANAVNQDPSDIFLDFSNASGLADNIKFAANLLQTNDLLISNQVNDAPSFNNPSFNGNNSLEVSNFIFSSERTQEGSLDQVSSYDGSAPFGLTTQEQIAFSHTFGNYPTRNFNEPSSFFDASSHEDSFQKPYQPSTKNAWFENIINSSDANSYHQSQTIFDQRDTLTTDLQTSHKTGLTTDTHQGSIAINSPPADLPSEEEIGVSYLSLTVPDSKFYEPEMTFNVNTENTQAELNDRVITLDDSVTVTCPASPYDSNNSFTSFQSEQFILMVGPTVVQTDTHQGSIAINSPPADLPSEEEIGVSYLSLTVPDSKFYEPEMTFNVNTENTQAELNDRVITLDDSVTVTCPASPYDSNNSFTSFQPEQFILMVGPTVVQTDRPTFNAEIACYLPVPPPSLTIKSGLTISVNPALIDDFFGTSASASNNVLSSLSLHETSTSQVVAGNSYSIYSSADNSAEHIASILPNTAS